MVYVWLDKTTEIYYNVERPMKDINIPPTKEEMGPGVTDKEFSKADWERQIVGGVMLVNFGNKGRYGKV